MMRAYIEVLAELCKGCGLCIHQCPKGLIGASDKTNIKGIIPVKFNDPHHKCTGCGFCFFTCPDFAIEVFREVKVYEENT